MKISILLALLISSSVWAQSDGNFSRYRHGQMAPRPANGNSAQHAAMQIDAPMFQGDGCPDGSASITLAPDKKSLAIIFDSFAVSVGSADASQLDDRILRDPNVRRYGARASFARKTCNLSVPFDIPAGYQVSIVQIDYRGYNFIPQGGMTGYLARFFFTDARTGRQVTAPISRKTEFYGPLDEDYTLSSEFTIGQSPAWTPCGAKVVLNISSGISVRSNSILEETMATIDSVDLAQQDEKLEYHLNWRSCGSTNPVPNPRPNRPTRPGYPR